MNQIKLKQHEFSKEMLDVFAFIRNEFAPAFRKWLEKYGNFKSRSPKTGLSSLNKARLSRGTC